MQNISNTLAVSIYSGLMWHELLHFSIGLVLSFMVWKKTGNLYHSSIPIILAFLPDIDHIFDYWGYYGFGFNLPDFVKMDYFNGPGRAFIPLHALEYLLILIPLSIKKGWSHFITPMTLGLTAHYLLDIINVGNIIFYSLIYRYLVGFRIFN